MRQSPPLGNVTAGPRASLCRWAAIVLLFTVFCSFPVRAQQNSFHRYGQEQGLSNLDVNALTQDSLGFIWVATDNGAFRYEGTRFHSFGSSDGLPDTEIESIHSASDGSLWAGGRWGAAWFDGRKFHYLKVDRQIIVSGRNRIASDSKYVYLATQEGLYRARASGASYEAEQLSSEPARALTFAPDGKLWVACGSDVCLLLNDSLQHVGIHQGLPVQTWQSIAVRADGSVWVRSPSSMFVRPPGSERFIYAAEGVRAVGSSSAPLLADARLGLLAPATQGLGIWNGRSWRVVGAAQGLSDGVTCVLRDRQGSLWLGLNGSGLARWIGDYAWESWTVADGLAGTDSYTVLRDSNGWLWLGSTDGISVLKPGSQRWEHQPLPGLLKGSQIETLVLDRDNNVWAGASPGGLYWLDRNAKLLRVFGPHDGLDADRIFGLVADHDNRIWAATSHGVFRSNKLSAGGKICFERLFIPGSADDEWFFHPIIDHKGDIWIAASLGLAHFSNGRWERLGRQRGLLEDSNLNISEAADGSLWVAYVGALGVTRMTRQGSQFSFQHFDARSGLSSNKAYSITGAADGTVWIGTDSGVDSYKNGLWRHYDNHDGLIWNDTNSNGVFADSDGSVWFSTSRGLSHFTPWKTAAVATQPPILTSVWTGHRNLLLSGLNPALQFSNRSLEFELADINFRHEETRRFRYRLTNFDDRWEETDSSSIRYPQLPPGAYTFEAQSWNQISGWSKSIAFPFSIAAPWWGTLIAKISSVVGMISLVLLFIWRRTVLLTRQKRSLERAIEARTRQLAHAKQIADEERERAEAANRAKSDFLANMSHEIRTPMNGVLGLAEILLNTEMTEEQRSDMLTLRDSAESLLGIINEILDFSKVEAGKITLDSVVFKVRDTVAQCIRGLLPEANTKRLALFSTVDESVPEFLVGDELRVRQVLLNLVANALKFTPAGEVSIEVTAMPVEAGQIELHFLVRDTGIGIAEVNRDKIFAAFTQADASTTRRFGGTGLGLTISSRLVALMGGRIWVDSEPGRGSDFHFTARLQPASAVDSSSESLTASRLDEFPLRVLVGDDNAINRKVAQKLLQIRGHEVVAVPSGKELLSALRNGVYDAVFVDIQMPDMDGFEVTDAIRGDEANTGRRQFVVAMTAHALKGDRERFLAAGMDAYLPKPIRIADLTETLALARQHIARTPLLVAN